jgi:predicted nucleic acid-binding protein
MGKNKENAERRSKEGEVEGICMVNYCLDTNIIIEFLRGNNEMIKKVNDVQQYHQLFTTPITLCEAYKGAFLSTKKDSELPIMKEFIETLEIAELDKIACEEFGEEFARLKKKGKIMSEFDLIIAAIVKTNNLILVTRDKKDFEHIDVKIEVW